MCFEVNISDDDLATCENALNAAGKYLGSYPIDIYDKNGELCVSVKNEIYIRDLNYAGD